MAPATLLYLIQVGYPADFILELGVESIGGLRNRSDHAGEETKADPEFLRLAMLLRRIQERRGIALRVEDSTDKQQTVTFLFRPEALTEEAIREVAEVKDLLGLARDRDQFKIVFSPVRTRPNEPAVNSRSMLQIMGGARHVRGRSGAGHRRRPGHTRPGHEAVAFSRCCASRPAPRRPATRSCRCSTATCGSGSTTGTGDPSERSRPCSSCSPWPTPTLAPGCR